MSMASPISDDDLPQTHRANEELLDLIQQWNLDNSERDIVAVVAGKSGTGKSTLINNFLTLDAGTKVADTRLQPTSVTKEVERYDGKVNGVRIRAIDMPGLHALDASEDIESDVVAALTHVTDGEADILIYCVSLTQRLDLIDKKNIATLIKAFGKKIWDNSILVLTHADSVLQDEDNASNLDEIVEKFMTQLQKILAEYEVNASIKPFSSSCHTNAATAYNEHSEATSDVTNAPHTAQELRVEITAIPTGKRPFNPPGWRDSLLAQIIAMCQSKTVSKLMQLEGISLEKVKKKLKKGVKVAAAAGAIGGASGTVLGAGIGSAIGAAIGGALTAPIGGIGAVPTAAGGAAVGAVVGTLAGGGSFGTVASFAGGIGSACNSDLFEDIVFYYKVQSKLKELQKKEQNVPA